ARADIDTLQPDGNLVVLRLTDDHEVGTDSGRQDVVSALTFDALKPPKPYVGQIDRTFEKQGAPAIGGVPVAPGRPFLAVLKPAAFVLIQHAIAKDTAPQLARDRLVEPEVPLVVVR